MCRGTSRDEDRGGNCPEQRTLAAGSLPRKDPKEAALGQRQRQVQLRCGAHLRLLRSAAAVPPSTSALHRHCGVTEVVEVQRAVGEHPQPTDETASCVGHGVVLGCSGRSPLFAPDIQILDLRQRSLCFSSRLISWQSSGQNGLNEWEWMAGLLSTDRAENNNLMLESLKRTSCRRSSRKPPTAASKRRSFEETPVTDVLRRDVHRFGSLPSKALVLQH